MRVLVVSKSLCGYVSNQVQYNMEREQYFPWIKYIYNMYLFIIIIYIYIYSKLLNYHYHLHLQDNLVIERIKFCQISNIPKDIFYSLFL